MIEAHEEHEHDDMDDSKGDDCVEENHTDESKIRQKSMIEAHETHELDDSNSDHCVEDNHTDKSKMAHHEVEISIPTATWPPEIIPPPEGTHLGCSICGDSYYSVRVQEVATSLGSPDNQKS